MKHFFLLLSLLFCLQSQLMAQDFLRDSTYKKPKKTWPLLATGGGIYTLGMIGLGQLWYDAPPTSFRFFNDNAQWKQLDKMGHFYTSYHLGRLGYAMLEPTQLSNPARRWLGGGMGFILLFPVEILDGFSPNYGASVGDWTANALGSLAFILQAGKRPFIQPKFSFQPTHWANLRPELLGYNLSEQWLKDYNGQTYWFSLDLAQVFPNGHFPKWLNLALGYGAEGMVYAREAQNRAAGYESYRQYYLSLDLDFSYLHPRSKFLRGLLSVIECVKVPLPTLEFSRQRWRVHPIHF